MTKLAYFGQGYAQDTLESVVISNDTPRLTSDLDITITLPVSYEQNNFINSAHILTIRALSNAIVEAVPIPIKSKCIIPNLIGEPTLLKVIESENLMEKTYVPLNNNLLVNLVVLNQDNYLDEIPTIISGTPIETPFWS
jgi:hypothetical protein